MLQFRVLFHCRQFVEYSFYPEYQIRPSSLCNLMAIFFSSFFLIPHLYFINSFNLVSECDFYLFFLILLFYIDRQFILQYRHARGGQYKTLYPDLSTFIVVIWIVIHRKRLCSCIEREV